MVGFSIVGHTVVANHFKTNILGDIYKEVVAFAHAGDVNMHTSPFLIVLKPQKTKTLQLSKA